MPASPPAALGEATVALEAHHDVVENGDAAEITDLAEASGQLHVRPGRRRIARYGDLLITGGDATAETTVLQAPPPELPIDRALAGPGLLADTIVRRWQDHLPLHRLERIYGREGLELARSTICGWHESLGGLVKPLLDAMWMDARGAPYLCTDATGVLVQAREKCRRGHFWVVIAPERHVLFRYTAKHDSAAVDGLLEGYEGYLSPTRTRSSITCTNAGP